MSHRISIYITVVCKYSQDYFSERKRITRNMGQSAQTDSHASLIREQRDIISSDSIPASNLPHQTPFNLTW